MNYFSWLLSHGQDFKDLLAIEEKCRADLPTAPSFGTIAAWYISHKADLSAGEALVAKIASDYPHAAPKPGPLKAADFAAALNAEAVAIGQPGHPFLNWIITNWATIAAALPSIIALFGGGAKP